MNKIDLLRKYIEKQGISINSLAIKMGTNQSTLWRNLNNKNKTTLEKFDEMLYFLGITESDLYKNTTYESEQNIIIDGKSVTGVGEETAIYKKQAEKINNKDRTMMDQAEALKLANEHIGKLIDMNMSLLERIAELNKMISMKMFLICVFMTLSFTVAAQCGKKSKKGDNTIVVNASNVKHRLNQYMIKNGVRLDTVYYTFQEYINDTEIHCQINYLSDSLAHVKCTYDAVQFGSNINGIVENISIWKDIYAKAAFDKIICIFKDVPITFERTEVVKF